jgi:EpsI family protein
MSVHSLAIVLAAVGLIAVWRPAYAALEASGPQGAPALARVDGVSGWSAIEKRTAPWRPQFVNAAAERVAGFEKGGRRVDLYLGYYRGQTQGAELIAWHNQLVAAGDKRWRKVASGEREIEFAGSPLRIRTVELVGPGGSRLLVWRWYWVNGRFNSSDALAKGYATLDRLLGRGDDAAAVVIYAPMSDARDTTAAEVLAMFAADMGSTIEQRLVAARGR